MSDIAELVERTERLQDHVEALREELDALRRKLELLQPGRADPGSATDEQTHDCLAIAAAMADDLGPGFSAERPHDLAGRGDDWFQQP